MNSELDNRWSDAARQAALAVRKARAMMANPRKDNLVPKRGGLAPKPMVYAGGSATFDERTGTRTIPEKNVWVPPPDSDYWKDPQWVADYKATVAELKKAGTVSPKVSKGPNIFYSSSYPYGPGQEGNNVQGIFRYDPKNPLDASELGYNTGKGKSGTKAMPPKRGGTGKPKAEDRRFYTIGGKRYIKIGNKLAPYDKTPAGEKTKVFYEI